MSLDSVFFKCPSCKRWRSNAVPIDVGSYLVHSKEQVSCDDCGNSYVIAAASGIPKTMALVLEENSDDEDYDNEDV